MCKSDKERYGPFPLGNTNWSGSGPCGIEAKRLHIRNKRHHGRSLHQGSEKDIEKSQATLQLAIRVKGIQEDKSYHVSSVQKNARHPT